MKVDDDSLGRCSPRTLFTTDADHPGRLDHYDRTTSSVKVGGMWNERSAKQRCRTIASAAAVVCENSQALIAACASSQRVDPVETITSELFPLCAAMRYIGKRGPKILTARRVGSIGRPAWLFGVRSVVHRVPLGDVLILGTWNYPLLLPGVQIAQALAAGNRVQLKPAVGTERASEILCDCFYNAGVPKEQLQQLDSSTRAATEAIESGVDLIVLTGSAETGKKVLQAASGELSATIMELSGCDAVVVLPGHDPERLIRSLLFGLRFNGGATCIGPRRLIVERGEHDRLIEQLREAFRDQPPVTVHPAARASVAEQIGSSITQGAIDLLGHFDEARLRDHGELKPLILDGVTESHPIASADVFAPILSVIQVGDSAEAIRLVNQCPYRLAASVFGNRSTARSIADQLDVGTVTINDLIAPTADPRLPFGGRGQSGFGVTRGPEGLLSMSAAKVVSTRYGKMMPHLRDREESDAQILSGALQLSHGRSLRFRLAGLRELIRGVKKG